MVKRKCIQWQISFVTAFLILEAMTSMAIQDSIEDLTFKMIGCIPCSQKFVVSSYFEKETSLDDASFEKYLTSDFISLDSCTWHEKITGNTMKLLIVHRQLIGEGSHRHLITSMVLEVDSLFSRLDADFCRAVIIERLPAGIFADPFELQHLVQKGVLLDASVFGDANLELPSALSNRTVVEIHMDIQHAPPSGNQKVLDYSLKLPLHVRYPPLDASGYSRAVIGQPDLLIYCKPKSCTRDRFSPIILLNTHYSVDGIEWLIPCGIEHHAIVVSVLTFFAAFASALWIVYSAISSSKKTHTKLA